MNLVNKTTIIKKWVPIIVIVSFVVLAIGLLFKISVVQIISSVAISLVLIISGLLFQMVGRNRSRSNDDEKDVNDINKGV